MECERVLVQYSCLHQTVEEWDHIVLCKLGVGHPNDSIEVVLKNSIFHDEAKHVISKNKLVRSIVHVS